MLFRIMPEVPEQMQDNLAHLELEANESRNSQYGGQQYGDPQRSSTAFNNPHPMPTNTYQQQQQQPPQQPIRYSSLAHPPEDLPNFSPFPKLKNPLPHVPPSDDQKLDIIDSARQQVLNSNDPEMQLAWSQDALTYVITQQVYEERIAELDGKPVRPGSPSSEHQARVDATSIVNFLADQKHPRALFMKAMWLEFGSLGMIQDKKGAFRLYLEAAGKGYARAYYRMGMQFEQSNEPMKAIENYQKGVAAGDAASNYRLGMAHLRGQLGQQLDFARAIQLLRASAQDADENAPQGAYVLGMLQARQLPQVQINEVILSADQQAARDNIAKSAYLGFAKAQVKMGTAYELCDLGCEFNPALSLHYNALAARQGDADAEMAISKWFLCGHEGEEGFKKNDELAYAYAYRAAQSGLPTAEFALGYFYEIGLHVSSNTDKALEWYEKAAAKGNTDAQNRIEGLHKSQRLSKKDHENVAISRIKSQHGSMRGQRPARFQQAQAPPLPTISDEYRPSTAAPQNNLPPRGSSRTPYPADDGPPMINLPERPATVAPYPTDDMPTTVGAPRHSLAGGFVSEYGGQVPDNRRTSGPAFGIHSGIYPNGGRLGAPGQMASQSMTNLPLRPATTLANSGPQSGSRISSGVSQPLNSRPPSGQHDPYRPPRKDSQPTHAGAQQPGIGYVAPQTGMARPSLPQTSQSTPDIGFVAPLQPNKQRLPSQQLTDKQRLPSQANGPSSRPPQNTQQMSGALHPQPGTQQNDRIPTGGGRMSTRPPTLPNTSLNPPMNNTSRPGSVANAGAMVPPGAGLPIQQQHQQQQQRPSSQASKPTPHPDLAPSKKPSGNGPKTFEQMGVPAAQKESDCVSLFQLPSREAYPVVKEIEADVSCAGYHVSEQSRIRLSELRIIYPMHYFVRNADSQCSLTMYNDGFLSFFLFTPGEILNTSKPRSKHTQYVLCRPFPRSSPQSS